MKKNKGLVISLIIFIIATIILGSYIVYDKILKEKTPEIKETEVKVDEKDNSTVEEEGKETEDKYQMYLENLEKNISVKVAWFTIDSVNDKRRSIVLNEDGSLYLEYSADMKIGQDKFTSIPSFKKESNSKGIKLNISNIVDIFFIEGMGQSAIETLYALDNKGNIYFIASSLDWDDNKITFTNFQPTKIEGLKNVVNINGYKFSDGLSGGNSAEVIDIDGNKYDLLNYTNKYHIYDSAI